MTIITLTTDFGLTDSYVGAMKGVILAIAPNVTLVDISHQVSPQDVIQAAHVLKGAIPYFPPGTVHVVVVDPGVGSSRHPIALHDGRCFFVGPDNGVFSFLLRDKPAVIELDNPAYWLPQVSQTFHGRDIFSPTAAHLAAGVPFHQLGSPMDNPVTLDEPQPQRLATGGLRGQIIHCDRFGNLISNIPGPWLSGLRWRFRIAGQDLIGPSPTYAAVQSGDLVALVGSTDVLEVAVRDGSAAAQLQVGVREPIEAWPHETTEGTAQLAE